MTGMSGKLTLEMEILWGAGHMDYHGRLVHSTDSMPESEKSLREMK